MKNRKNKNINHSMKVILVFAIIASLVASQTFLESITNSIEDPFKCLQALTKVFQDVQ